MGGDLCLYQPGLMLLLCSEDAVIFHSCEVTHFNLTYTGKQASLVLHSDREGLKWVDGKMCWARNLYFNGL